MKFLMNSHFDDRDRAGRSHHLHSHTFPLKMYKLCRRKCQTSLLEPIDWLFSKEDIQLGIIDNNQSAVNITCTPEVTN